MVVSGLAALVVAACGSTAGSPTASVSPTPSATSTPAPTPSPTASPSGMVAILMMENHSLDQVGNQPDLASLAALGVTLTGYHSVAHPSEPNYLAITSGSTWGVTDDSYHLLPAGKDLGAQLTTAGISWKAYMEGLTNGCLKSPSPYAAKHNPFASYGSTCPANVVDFSQLAADESAGTLPRFVWITPNLCDDDHDCAPAKGDAWLQTVVPGLMSQASFKNHGVLFIVWDEGDEGGASYSNPAALVLSPDVKAGSSVATSYNHYSVLATIETRLGLPLLGNAAQAAPMTDVLPAIAV